MNSFGQDRLFLPSAHLPDEDEEGEKRDARRSKRDDEALWIAEVFAYFGIRDASRETVEDLGLIEVVLDNESERSLRPRSDQTLPRRFDNFTERMRGALTYDHLAFIVETRPSACPAVVDPHLSRILVKLRRIYGMRSIRNTQPKIETGFIAGLWTRPETSETPEESLVR